MTGFKVKKRDNNGKITKVNHPYRQNLWTSVPGYFSKECIVLLSLRQRDPLMKKPYLFRYIGVISMLVNIEQFGL